MPNVGTWAQTDDIRIGMGLQGLMHLRQFIEKGGVFIGSNSTAEFAVTNNLGHGVAAGRAGSSTRVVGSLLRTRNGRCKSPNRPKPLPDNLAMYTTARLTSP